jgi:hypothetical protein
MDDVELRRFINNLINYTEGGDVDLPTRMEKMVWNDLVEVLNHNERKRERAAERSRKNGTKGGRPNNPVGSNETQNNPVGYNETQQVNEEPSGINNNLNNLLMDNGKWLMDNGKGLMVNGKGSIDNGNKLLDIMKQVIEEGYVQEEEVLNWKIGDTREKLNYIFFDYPGWESDLLKLGLDGFIIKIENNKNMDVDFILHSTLKAHLTL